jgi:hypothetical protein
VTLVAMLDPSSHSAGRGAAAALLVGDTLRVSAPDGPFTSAIRSDPPLRLASGALTHERRFV